MLDYGVDEETRLREGEGGFAVEFAKLEGGFGFFGAGDLVKTGGGVGGRAHDYEGGEETVSWGSVSQEWNEAVVK